MAMRCAECRPAAVVLAHQKAVQDALTGKGDPDAVVAAPPPGLAVQLVSDGQVIAGTPPRGPAWKAEIAVGPASAGRQRDRVAAARSAAFLARVQRRIPSAPGVDLGLVGGHAGGGLDRRRPRHGYRRSSTGVPYDATFGGTEVRAAAVPVPASKGGSVKLFATYPSSQLADAVRIGPAEGPDPTGGGVPAGCAVWRCSPRAVSPRR